MEPLLLFAAIALMPFVNGGGEGEPDDMSGAGETGADDPDQTAADQGQGDMIEDIARELRALDASSDSGTAGNDLIRAEAGTTQPVLGSAGNDALIGSEGDDTLNGEAGDDTLLGGAGNDTLTDTEGSNILSGEEGDDSLTLSAGSIGSGGVGADVFTLNASTEDGPIIITDFSEDEGDTLNPDVLIDTDLSAGDGLTGQVWEDGLGQDFYFADTLVASIKGGQSLDPGAVNLTLRPTGDSFAHGDEAALIRAAGADQTIEGGDGDDSIFHFLTPQDTGADVLRGGDGNDRLFGVGDSGVVYSDGMGGGYSLTTGPLLEGGEGDDILLLKGQGTMTGGAGEDTFGIEYAPLAEPDPADPVPPAEITDFVRGEDVLYLETTGVAEGGELALEPWEGEPGTDIYVNDVLVARVAGAVLTEEDILTPERSLRADLLLGGTVA